MKIRQVMLDGQPIVAAITSKGIKVKIGNDDWVEKGKPIPKFVPSPIEDLRKEQEVDAQIVEEDGESVYCRLSDEALAWMEEDTHNRNFDDPTDMSLTVVDGKLSVFVEFDEGVVHCEDLLVDKPMWEHYYLMDSESYDTNVDDDYEEELED